MDRHVTATEANQNFSRLLAEVQKGETVVITSRNKPVARMTPVPGGEDRAAAMAEFHAFVNSLPPMSAGPWKREDLYE